MPLLGACVAVESTGVYSSASQNFIRETLLTSYLVLLLLDILLHITVTGRDSQALKHYDTE